MFGFLAAFSLAGLATAAWPLYLHLRRQRERKIQVVPSLKLFQLRSVPARRRRVEQLFLLLSRIGIVTVLFIIVSQPYLETNRILPLPAVTRSEDPNLFLGVVIDDSLTAFHGAEPSGRLRQARAWLLEQLDQLPDTVRVSVATTTYPRPTGFLTREHARALLEGMEVIPREGSASEAMKSLLDLFEKRSGALVVVAPLDASLWELRGTGEPSGSLQKIFFHDLTGYRVDAYIRGVLPRDDAARENNWICELSGDQESLSGKELRILDRKGKIVSRRRISLHEALRHRILLGGDGLEEAFQVQLEDVKKSAHPWLRYYVATGSRITAARRVIFFREEGEEALLATRILLAMVRSLRPEISRTFVSFSEVSTAELPAARAAIVVGSRDAPPRLATWLEEQIEAGIQVLCLPGSAGAADQGSGSWLRLPSWRGPVGLSKNELTPLRIHGANLPDTHRFDDLLLADLEDLETLIIREPVFTSGGKPIIVAAAGKTLLSLARPNKRTALWALGVEITTEEGSPVYHPVLPLLLDWILFPAGEGGGGPSGSILVGESANIASWFGREPDGGRILAPGGKEFRLAGEKGSSSWIPISEAGIYELKSDDPSQFRVANHPRPAGGSCLDPSSWEKLSRAREVVWLGEKEFIPPEELKGSPLGTGKHSRRYDLTHLMAAILAGFLGLELLLLLGYWRRARA